MAIGRSFSESLQKALRSMETGLTGMDEVALDGVAEDGEIDRDLVFAALGEPTPDRILRIGQALRAGLGIAEVARASHFDPWFVAQIADVEPVPLEELLYQPEQ